MTDTMSSMTSAKEIGEADNPPLRRLAAQHDGADLVRDGSKIVSRPEDRHGRDLFREFVLRAICHVSFRSRRLDVFSISGFGLRSLARYVVLGRVFSSSSNL